MKGLREQFNDWLQQQNPAEAFKAANGTDCAVYRFLKASGYPVSHVGVLNWYDSYHDKHPLSDRMKDVILAAHDVQNSEGVSTISALASRLSDHAGGE